MLICEFCSTGNGGCCRNTATLYISPESNAHYEGGGKTKTRKGARTCTDTPLRDVIECQFMVCKSTFQPKGKLCSVSVLQCKIFIKYNLIVFIKNSERCFRTGIIKSGFPFRHYYDTP